MGKCFMIIKFTLNNTFIFLQQCQFILHSSVHSCFSQIPLNENTISFPWDISHNKFRAVEAFPYVKFEDRSYLWLDGPFPATRS